MGTGTWVWVPVFMAIASLGDRHLGMGASSPKMRIEKRKPRLPFLRVLAFEMQSLGQVLGYDGCYDSGTCPHGFFMK